MTANPTTAVRKTYASVVGRSTSPTRIDEGAVDEDGFATVTRRRRVVQSKPDIRTRSKFRASMLPAVLIKVVDGETFDKTLKAVRSASIPTSWELRSRK